MEMIPKGPQGITPSQTLSTGFGKKSKGLAGEEDFSTVLDKLRNLEKESKSMEAKGPTNEMNPGELARRLDEAEETFQKAMQIRNSLERAWRESRKSYGHGR